MAVCLALPDATSAQDGAGCLVNPLTVLEMLETARLGSHRAAHTAAATNWLMMLVRTSSVDGMGLVNVVRRPEQADALHAEGADHVVEASQPD